MTMLASLIVQRTNYPRAARLYVLIVLGAITVVSLAFLALGIQLPAWVVILGRWIPALVSLLVMRLVPLDGGVSRWWSLRPGGARRFFAGVGVGVFGLLAVYVVTALVGSLLGLAPFQDGSVLLGAAPSLLVTLLVITLSTFGEEVGWRGFLQRLLATHGFWRASAMVSAVWVAFHIPVHGVLVLQGQLPWQQGLASTVGLFALGMFLSALVVRFGSVWPAVFGHALPLSSINLLAAPDGLTGAGLLGLSAVEFVLLLAAAWLVSRRRPRA